MQKTVTETEAARYISMSRSYLRKSRCEGQIGKRTQAPPWIKTSKRSVRYLVADLDQWLEEHRVSS